MLISAAPLVDIKIKKPHSISLYIVDVSKLHDSSGGSENSGALAGDSPDDGLFIIKFIDLARFRLTRTRFPEPPPGERPFRVLV